MRMIKMRNSTSWCRISGDCEQPLLQTHAWRLLNRLDNDWCPEATHPSLQQCHFTPQLDPLTWERINAMDGGISSPARRLILHFLAQFPWQPCADQLGPLRIWDLGCGSGMTGQKLQQFSGGRVASYAGFDVVANKNWDAIQTRYPFITCRVMDSHQVFANLELPCNLLFSQTALEHIPNDLQLFSRIATWIHQRQGGGALLQLHFLPSTVCLQLYDLHGYRQYSPRKVVRLLERLPKECHATLFSLGGAACTRLHLEWVGPYRDIRKVNATSYNDALYNAMKQDNDSISPVFYALVIHSQGFKVF